MSDLLPPNATTGERSMSNAIARIADVPVVVREVWNPDACPRNLLAWMAWAFSVDEWDATWSDEQKRETIKSSIAIHRYKGTIGAVIDALAALFHDARVQEWFNQTPAGDPYTFRILLTSEAVGIGEAEFHALLRVIDNAKNLRSHLEHIQVTSKTGCSLTVAACAGLGSEIVLSNYQWASVIFNETTICM